MPTCSPESAALERLGTYHRGMVGRRSWAWSLVVLIGGCSVGEGPSGTSFGDVDLMPGEDDTGGSSSGGAPTTGVSDPSATGPDPSGSTAAGATTEPSTSTSGADETEGDASSGAAPSCGNGVVEAAEACDGDDLAGMTCVDVGDFDAGTLACDASCAFDMAGCTMAPAVPVEVCETINLPIPDSGGGAVSSTVMVPGAGMVTDVTVSVTLTHSFIGDLTVDVQHGAATVRVYDRECGSEDDMNLVFDDAGAALDCAASISGAATLPSAALSAFDGTAAGGAWTFTFQDNAGVDVGTVTEVCVRVTS